MIRRVSTEDRNLFNREDEGDKPVSVAQACRLIKSALGSVRNGQPFRIAGEISDFRAQRGSGHWYFTLKDPEDGGVVNCAFFAQRRRMSGIESEPTEGAAVVVTGALDYYPPFGKLSFIVSRLSEQGTGDLHEQFRRMHATLKAEGYFDPEQKIPCPDSCRRIAILTSPDGAVRHDIERTARGRWPGIELVLVPIPVQGSTAAPRIAEAIHAIRRAAPSLGIEAIILARGGGSLEDLWVFNEREVADAIHTSRLRAKSAGQAVPLISAIGHESDTTISDEVADLRASTPTQAAEILVRSADDDRRYLAATESRLLTVHQARAARARARLDACLRHPILRRPLAMLEPHARKLGERTDALERAVAQDLATRRMTTNGLIQRLHASSPLARQAVARTRLDALAERMNRAIGVRMTSSARALEARQRNLEAVGPRQVLARGYSITLTADGRVVRSREDAESGVEIETRLADGSIRSQVTSTSE